MSGALGRLASVDLRDIWKTEAQDFTPWLAREENLALLGETLGIDLELEGVEQSVGVFRADILCKDTVSGKLVLIENQLERTDHSHLGQLITYAAGLDAVTIVWIAARVSEEHRAALDWLNEITEQDVRFFGLEVELWRIGDSPAAPKFNMVSKPNDWTRTAAAGGKIVVNGALSDTRLKQRDYWAAVEELVEQKGGPLRPVAAQAQSWLTHGIGKSGVLLSLAMNRREHFVRVEVYLTGPWSKSDFRQLHDMRDAIERELGMSLDWQPLPEKSDARICIALPDSDPFDEPDWSRQHRWLVETATSFHRVFRPHVLRLTRDDTIETTP